VVPTSLTGRRCLTAYIRDITERKRAAEALLVSEARFGHLSDSGIIGIVIADTLGNITKPTKRSSTSSASRAQSLLRKSQLGRHDAAELRHLDDAAVRQLERTGVAKPWEKEYIRRTARVRLCLWRGDADEPRSSPSSSTLANASAPRRSGQSRQTAEQESAQRQRLKTRSVAVRNNIRQSQKMSDRNARGASP